MSAWREQFDRLWSELVPAEGQALTTQGELVRCVGRLTDEAERNGNMNWGTAHQIMCQFVAKTLHDEKVFTQEELGSISGAIELAMDFRIANADDCLSLLGRKAVQWCSANPTPVPHERNEHLDRLQSGEVADEFNAEAIVEELERRDAAELEKQALEEHTEEELPTSGQARGGARPWWKIW